MAAVECKLNAGIVCMQHCKNCSHFDQLTWHCMYYLSMLQPLEEMRHRLLVEQSVAEKLKQLHELWREK